jgi:RNase P/RNase MRP subunit p29
MVVNGEKGERLKVNGERLKVNSEKRRRDYIYKYKWLG